MNSKKAITLLIMATMILSLIPVISVNAITVDSVDDGLVNYYGDTIIVYGYGATPGRDVKVYWDGIDQVLNTTKAEGNGDFEIWFDIPEATNGTHYITVENTYNSDIHTYPGPIIVGPSIEVDPESGLKNDEVTIQGYGFGEEQEIVMVQFNGDNVTTSPSSPESNDVGSWTATFDVPDLPAGFTYTVFAEDNETNTADTDFKIGASITLNKEEGPSGTVVRVTGRGFTYGAYINGSGIVELDGVPCGFVTEDAKVKSNGQFTCDIVIPDVGKDEYELYVEEWNPAGPDVSATADFEQTGRPAIELSPTYGPVASTITVTGYNFTQISGEDVVLSMWYDGKWNGNKTVETNSNGEFTSTYRIPGSAGTPEIWAMQEDYNIDAQESFRVGFITVVIYPESAVAGQEVTVSGSGFNETDECNVTLNGDLWMDGVEPGAGGVINEVEWVPSMEPGVYEVVVTEIDSGIAVTVELTVTENTYVELSPMMAPSGYGVDIMGYNFAQNPSDDDLDFLLYNETDEWVIDVDWDETENNPVFLEADDDWDAGYFEGNWTVPDDDEISIGTYWLNITSGDGMYTQIAFEVVEKTVDIEPRKTVFRVGETLGFNVESSFMQEDSYIEVYDPSGVLYWDTDVFDEDVWTQVGTIMRVPYYSQVAGGNPMTFLEDAPIGIWTWEWYDDEDDLLDEGTFEVQESSADVLGGQVEDLNNKITDLTSQVDGISSDFDDVRSDIADVAAIAEQAVTAAQQAAEAVETVAQTANQANTAAENAATAAEAARDAANGLTTLVYGAIGAALVAALAAIVSLMQISRRIAG